MAGRMHCLWAVHGLPDIVLISVPLLKTKRALQIFYLCLLGETSCFVVGAD